ncbi:hypothetical protein H4219_003709 [Mycoemilia scoparia]|uniref:Alpha N-terminal protein methyltransferase 1 n=1 Tax=Mycoemilia scoparia TaxID=417184 RepID=A0A9W8A0J5_9FUNG|nr:hypothetical protein H4219_003709 [Mycoemilia scoparia]
MSVEACPDMEKDTWYTDAIKYWETIDPTISGMLGGLEFVHLPDIQGSMKFLTNVNDKLSPLSDSSPENTKPTYACDCGTGIGRVAKHFLLKKFDKVDLVEQNGKFLQAAQDTYLKEQHEAQLIGQYFAMGLQDFTPEKNKYDLIWCQWVLSHLTDEDLVKFLKRCKDGIKEPGGFIGIKENVVGKTGYTFDSTDSSATRSIKVFEELFKKAGLEIIYTMQQQGFPKGLFRVQMWALRPLA